jgi:copper chaperone NosL
MKCTIAVLVLTLILFATCFAAEPVKLSNRDECPVCGMYPAKYPKFKTEIVFKDGTYAAFDSPKDMFKYYFDLPRYNASRKQGDIRSVYVTDYQGRRWVDGSKAFYVGGSKVMGPMGKDLIPFRNRNEAEKFAAAHAGKILLQFNEISPDLVKSLD